MRHDNYLTIPARAKADQPIRLLQITDTHLRADPGFKLLGLNTANALADVIALAQDRHADADLVLASGDLVHDDGTAYTAVAAAYKPLGCPCIAIPGNHDEAALLRDQAPGTHLHWARAVDIGGWRLVMLDTSVAGSPGGHLPDEELNALHEALTDTPQRHTLICLHHPPLAMGSAWLDEMQIDNADAFWRIIDQHKQIRAVVFGHVHQAFHGWHGDISLLGAPSTCIQFAPGSDSFALDALTPGLRWLHLHADGRIDSGIERLARYPDDYRPRAASGY